jgi:subfamily B ATP-binding cassette protein HlyB/CyaB
MALQLGGEIAEADLAWTIGSLCQLNRIPFDPALLLQKFPAPHSVRQLIEALRSFGFRTGEGRIARAAFPCVGFMAEGFKPALLVKRDAERLLYFEAGSQAPQTLPVELLKETFATDVLLLRHESAKEPVAEDGAPKRVEFGFRWFWRGWLDSR